MEELLHTLWSAFVHFWVDALLQFILQFISNLIFGTPDALM